MIVKNPTFANTSDADFENKSTFVSVVLADKTRFQTAYPDLDKLTAAVKEFTVTLGPAANGGRVEIAKKNEARKEVEKLLKTAAAYVAMVAGDNISIILESGFEAKKAREARPTIGAPENIQVESGMNTGEMVLSVDTVKDAKTYHFEYTADPLSDTSTWITALGTRSTYEFAGLKPGQKYWFRVAAVGVGGAKVYSNEVASFVR
jgi:hypothetical protein